MSDNALSPEVKYLTGIEAVRQNPGRSGSMYAELTGIPDLETYLDKAVNAGTLIRRKNLPILGGWIYDIAV